MRISLFILGVGLILFMGCRQRQTNLQTEKAASTEQNISTVKKILAEGDNKNVDFLDEVCARDYKYYFPSNSQPLNLEEHKQLWKGFNDAFPDLSHKVESIHGMGDFVVARLTVRGTLMKEFTGILPEQQKVTVGQILILRFENSKVIEFWEEADLLGFYQQLGFELRIAESQ